MWDVKACIVCLSTGLKLYSLNTGNLRHEYNSISGLMTTKTSGMPDYLCVECCAFVKKFIKFQQKCQRAHYTLKQMLATNNEIKKTHIKLINRTQLGIMPSVSLMNPERMHYETHIFQWRRPASTSHAKAPIFDHIPTIHHSTLTKENTFEDVMSNTIEVEKDHIKVEDNNIKYSNEPEKKVRIKRKLAKIPASESKPTNINNKKDLEEETKFDTESADYMESNDATDDWFDMSFTVDNKADGAKFNEEYAQMVPISVKEAKAADAVKKLFMTGPHKCGKCGRGFRARGSLKTHSRMHDKHLQGNYRCEICDYHYKTQFLLDMHMTEKHMYKYLCRMCPEVSFDRKTAKFHYCRQHVRREKGKARHKNGERPAFLERPKKKQNRGKKKPMVITKDMFSFEPIKPEEQYTIIQERKTTRNYLDAKYKCELCFRGYRLINTYTNHMVKHDSSVSGNLQCDVCKLYFKDQRKMYKHMIMYHLNKYSCRNCVFVTTNRSLAVAHYKWHANVTYDCELCDKKFVKASTRLTHIRLKHPSTNICNLCGHSFVSSAGLVCHKKMTHSNEEIVEIKEPVDTSSHNYCTDCGILFASEQAFATHLGSSSKHVNTNISVQKTQRDSRKRMRREMGVSTRERVSREVGLVQEKRGRNGSSEVLNTGVTTSNNCEVCGKYLVNDVQARKHYESEHPGSDFLRRYMCEICGHTSRQYANLLVHMRTHTNEKPYGCPHCDRRFSMLSNRDRHLVVHTGEKRYQCQHCSRRFTQSSAVKLHIQTVHLKIPYAPWDKKNRKRRKELEAAGVSSDLNLVEAPPMPLLPQPQHKLLIDTQGEYINAYITYSDE